MPADTQKHLYDLVKHFGTAMVITHRPGGRVHARPMGVARLQAGLDAYFVTDIGSPKVAEIEADPRVALAFQGNSEDAVIYGRASIVHDRALIREMWREAWRLWFPSGKDDPRICLVRVDAEEGEYWDRSGTEGLRFLFEGTKAILQGRKPHVDDDPRQHAHVRLVK